jgi:YegS/Rv2252/BmrU family lipid kinase
MAGYRRFIAVGGDGTVHDVLNGIAAYLDWAGDAGKDLSFSDFTLGVIPVGSGNDWIRSIGVPKDVEVAAALFEKAKTRPQDVVKVTALDYDKLPECHEIAQSYMVNIGGVGIDARVAGRVNSLKERGKRGKILYVTSLIHAIMNRSASMAKVYCDDKLIYDGEYYSMAFGVGKYSGGGMRQTPEAVMDDGLLDITIIPVLPIGRIIVAVPKLFTGNLLQVPELLATKGKTMTVIPYNTECAEPVEVDGEILGKAPVRFEVMASQINIVVGA